MKTTIINNPVVQTTRESSIKRTEEILAKITDNWYLAWEQKVKGTRFTIMGYFVNGRMLFVQVFENGSVFHFGQTCSIRWDETEKQLIELYKI